MCLASKKTPKQTLKTLFLANEHGRYREIEFWPPSWIPGFRSKFRFGNRQIRIQQGRNTLKTLFSQLLHEMLLVPSEIYGKRVLAAILDTGLPIQISLWQQADSCSAGSKYPKNVVSPIVT